MARDIRWRLPHNLCRPSKPLYEWLVAMDAVSRSRPDKRCPDRECFAIFTWCNRLQRTFERKNYTAACNCRPMHYFCGNEHHSTPGIGCRFAYNSFIFTPGYKDLEKQVRQRFVARNVPDVLPGGHSMARLRDIGKGHSCHSREFADTDARLNAAFFQAAIQKLIRALRHPMLAHPVRRSPASIVRHSGFGWYNLFEKIKESNRQPESAGPSNN